MSRGNYHRVKPKVSFALASGFIVLVLLLVSGGVEIVPRLERVLRNPQALLVGAIFALLAMLLLWEW
jgi:hypothetical protein